MGPACGSHFVCIIYYKLFFAMMDFISTHLTDIIGYAASICMVLGYMPQAIYTIRTHDTDGIALPTFLMMAVGGFAFMMQGLLHKPDVLWALFLTNLVTTTCSCIVFGIKMYNDYFKKK